MSANSRRFPLPDGRGSSADPAHALAQGAVVVLGADTVVVAADGSLLGQPADREDARRMLGALIGRTHRVVTGVALLRVAAGANPGAQPGAGEAVTFADSARVRIGPVGAESLAAYLAGDDWRGKAGAYNLAELERRWSIEVRGDPDTVVGLPMRELRQRLADLGITPASAPGAGPAERRSPCAQP